MAIAGFDAKPDVISGYRIFDSVYAFLKEKIGAKRLLVCHGKRLYEANSYLREVMDELFSSFYCVRYAISSEPSPHHVDEAARIIVENNCDAVIGIGGGSVMDLAKAASAAVFMEHPVKEYLEGVGTQKPSGKRLPLILAPSTAGTGSEATYNAVLSEPGPAGYKKSLRHPGYLADFAVLDTGFIETVPYDFAFFSAMDATSQLFEAFISVKADKEQLQYAEQGLMRVAEALPAILAGNAGKEEQKKMMEAAFLSGVVLRSAGLGLVHGIAGPAGARLAMPHGEICARLIRPVMKHTVKKIAQEGKKDFLERFSNVNRILSRNKTESPYETENTLNSFFSLSKTKLSPVNITKEDMDFLIASYSHKNHPCTFMQEEVKKIIEEGFC